MDNALINRLNELAERSYNENRFLFTDFLDMSQLSIYYNMKNDLEYVGTSVSGGTDGCERCMVRFGSPESLGYNEEFPIILLNICPLQKKFSDKLTHRDFLGTVIGLGIDRSKVGDIIVKDNEGYIFVTEGISDYIMSNLTKVKHTNVKVKRCENIPDAISPTFADESLIVSSNRLDAVIARVYKLSRELAVRYISEGKVYLSGSQITENAKSLKNGDIVSVRGKGKFIFAGEGGSTRKDKLFINIKRYV